MKKYNSLVNSIDFYPGISVVDNDLYSQNNDGTTSVMSAVATKDIMYNPATGKLDTYDNVSEQHVSDMYYTGYMGDADERNARASHLNQNQNDDGQILNDLSDIPNNSKTAAQLGNR